MYTQKHQFNKLLFFFLILFSPIISAQTTIVKGEVVDGTGNYLPGVSILVEGTTTGTDTDFDGKYVLNIKTPNATLVFQYLGFETKKIKVGNQKIINVILNESADQLDEVQVVAFQNKRKIV